METLQKLAARIIDHWERGYGGSYNSTRREALSLVRLRGTLDEAVADVARECGTAPPPGGDFPRGRGMGTSR